MLNLIPQITQTWAIHNRTMLYLIDHLPEEAFDCSLSKRGGRNIAVQLAHCISVRYFRLEAFIKKHNLSFNEFPKNHVPNREELLEAFTVSGQIMEQVIENAVENEGKAPSFAAGIIPMIGYYISHEAHHRGHALLTMKESGIKIPDTLKWGVWEWNKI